MFERISYMDHGVRVMGHHVGDDWCIPDDAPDHWHTEHRPPRHRRTEPATLSPIYLKWLKFAAARAAWDATCTDVAPSTPRPGVSQVERDSARFLAAERARRAALGIQ